MHEDPVERFGGAANAPSVPPGPVNADELPTTPAQPGELLTPQQLRDYARGLAQEHALDRGRATTRPLLAEVERAGRELTAACRAMRAAAEAGRDLVPAEEWLVDNFHVVEDQIREIREDLPPGYYAKLPRLGTGHQAGYPRVYAAALAFVERTDALLDRDSLLGFIRAYQEVDPLSIGELWAVPIMLRVGLLLNLRRLADQEREQRELRERADRWADRLAERARQRPADMVIGVAELATSGEELSPVFLVRLLKRLRDQDVPLGAALEWGDQILAESGTTAAELARQQQHRQAAAQVSVGNSITAMRQIAALSWVEFFERASLVEETLSADPAGAYDEMEPASRDDYRRRIESLAGRSRASEIDAAQAAVALARSAAEVEGAQSRRAHVGYYLVGDGRQALEAQVGYRPPPAELLRRALRRFPTFTYLGTIGLLELVMLLGLVAAAGPLDPLQAGLLVLLLALPCSEIAVSLVNWATTIDLKPRQLPKLDFRTGLPASQRTMVVVPTLLSETALDELLSDLEVRYLANQDPHLHFALLTDLPDAEVEERPGEAALIQAASDGIADLNARHGRGRADRFYLFHRRRLWNPAQEVWMGWERKRGKLEEFNRLLRGSPDTNFSVQVGDLEILPEVRYVITLDTDTQLPRDVARRLVGIIAHPLQRPELDPELGCVRRGYAIIQPRASSTLTSGGRSLFARIFTGNTGLDPYTSAVSDVYQDLFGEASYYGKGIYDVDAFSAALHGRVPENHLLSHDLFESLFARTALASDVELLDDFPAHYSVHAGRQHRWVRGDWQQAVWLLPWVPLAGGGRAPNRLPLLARWKLFDNLRRSLLPLSLVALLVAGWTALPGPPLLWTAVALLALATPIFVHLTGALLRPDPGWSSSSWSGWRNLRTSLLQAGLALALLADQASLMADAIVRTLYRLWFSRRDLLEWEAAAEAERRLAYGLGPLWRRMWPASALAGAVLALVAATRPAALPLAAPILLLWFLSPAIAHRISRPTPPRERRVPPASTALLRLTARKTWRFFETFVTAEDNWLPPDNYQEDPRGVLARRTSPTNIGLYLLSVLAARDFHYVGLGELVQRLEATLDTLARLDQSHGHFFNWYDTVSLEVLQPAYISTVDSGNLAGHLLVLKHGCLELLDRPPVDERFLLALDDSLRLLAQAVEAGGTPLERSADRAAEALRRHVAQAQTAPPADWAGWAALLGELSELARPLAASEPLAAEQERGPIADDVEFWAGRLVALIGATQADLTALGPARRLGALGERLQRLAERAEALALAMNFRLLYDADRQLFAIGYNQPLGQRDNSFYDLLASEARLASLVAIAKGDVPQAHWFRLGRGLTAAGGNHALLSWSGTMFEYLMPLLATRSYPRTLLDDTVEAVVERQIQYGAARGVPWGISESAFNTLDLALNYQYQAFGVPGLGMKSGLADNLVVSPYSTILALQIRPVEAAQNLERLAEAGLDGQFGFYEAVDYTPRRVPPGRHSVIVRAFMAHHQGMSLVALDNVLHGDPMPRRFHTEPLIRATELLLQERIPDVPAVVPLAVAEDGRVTPQVQQVPLGQTERILRLDDPSPQVHLLSNGAYSVMLTPSGGGYSLYRGRLLTRWRADGTLDERGSFIYLRDLASGRSWSSGYQPTRVAPDEYQVTFQPEGVHYCRRDGDLETLTEVVVSPERNAEVRRVTVINLGQVAREIELTSYAEVVLAPGAADLAHQAFGGLFVETEVLPERGGALLCSRRPRAADEARLWLVHVAATRAEPGPTSFETSRFAFVGRNRTLDAPDALAQPTLAQTSGAVLDPIVSLRRVVRLAPDERVQVSFSTAVAESRDEALTLAEQLADPRAVDRTFELAWTDARVELRHLNISAEQMHRYLQLGWALLYGDRALRAPPEVLARNTRPQAGLWPFGISGDLPILLIRVDDSSDLSLIDELLRAHEYWRLSALTVDLVILNEDVGGYLQPLQEQLLALVGASPAHGRLGQHGGVFVQRADLMNEQDRVLLLSTAAVVLTTGQGSLSRQLARRGSRRADLPRPHPASSRDGQSAAPATAGERGLQFFNGRGGFSPDGREYVIELGPAETTPAPWCNVLANEQFGTLVSEAGLGYTWSGNSQTRRLTPWSNDPVVDPAGEALYLRDDADGAVWSPTPLPSHDDQPYRVRHGQGYTIYQHTSRGIDQELTVLVPPEAPVKLLRLRLRNDSAEPRRLSVTAFVEWVLGPTRERTAAQVLTEYAEPLGAVLASCPYVEPGDQVAFLAASERPASYTADRTEFLGRFGLRARPAALDRARLIGTVGAGYDPCAALQVKLELGPNETREVVWLLGQAADREQAAELIGRYADPARAEQALGAAVAHWDDLLGNVEVATPDRALDLLVNRWLLYQTLACRFWARSAFYQSGGAYGFRDQLQDALAVLYAAPEQARAHLLRSAARQFVEGDVQHWWHPDTGQGVRTRCSDDLLWLPFVVARYVEQTGDRAVLDEPVPFLTDRPLAPDEQEIFGVPAVSTQVASLYDHCLRALERAQTRGPHDLPLIGSGDWNDGMNRVGHLGRGESVWVGWFLAATLQAFAPLCQLRGDAERAEALRAAATRLGTTIDEQAWDGAWYRRAYFDDGTPLGSASNDACAIDAIAQSWSVIAGVGRPDRARQAMSALGERLIRPDLQLILLLAPPFQETGLDPGYIKGYLPGVRENGGQYTHGAIWAVQATAMLGDGDRAAELFGWLNPINHALRPEAVERYKVEPYVVAADVYAADQHLGRGGWTWYTGSAGWMYRLAVESLLGFRLRGDHFTLDPVIPRAWPGFTLRYRAGSTRYEISVENPAGLSYGVRSVALDGRPLVGQAVPLLDDGQEHRVRVVLGPPTGL